MERISRAEKNIRIVTGIIAFIYFAVPFVLDGMHVKLEDGYLYDFLFLSTFTYDWFCEKFQHHHFLSYPCQFIVFLILWWLLFLLCRTIYEMLNEIYLDRRRFTKDSDEHDD